MVDRVRAKRDRKLDDPPQDREAKKQGVADPLPLAGGKIPSARHHQAPEQQEQHPPSGSEKAGHRDQHSGGKGKGLPQMGKHTDDLRHHEGQEKDDHQPRHGRHEKRIRQGRSDPVYRTGLLLEVVGQPGQRKGKRAALLACAHHAYVQFGKCSGLGLDRTGERHSASDAFLDLDEDTTAFGVVHLRGERLKRRNHRNARSDKGGKLAGEKREKLLTAEQREGRKEPAFADLFR